MWRTPPPSSALSRGRHKQQIETKSYKLAPLRLTRGDGRVFEVQVDFSGALGHKCRTPVTRHDKNSAGRLASQASKKVRPQSARSSQLSSSCASRPLSAKPRPRSAGLRPASAGTTRERQPKQELVHQQAACSSLPSQSSRPKAPRPRSAPLVREPPCHQAMSSMHTLDCVSNVYSLEFSQSSMPPRPRSAPPHRSVQQRSQSAREGCQLETSLQEPFSPWPSLMALRNERCAEAQSYFLPLPLWSVHKNAAELAERVQIVESELQHAIKKREDASIRLGDALRPCCRPAHMRRRLKKTHASDPVTKPGSEGAAKVVRKPATFVPASGARGNRILKQNKPWPPPPVKIEHLGRKEMRWEVWHRDLLEGRAGPLREARERARALARARWQRAIRLVIQMGWLMDLGQQLHATRLLPADDSSCEEKGNNEEETERSPRRAKKEDKPELKVFDEVDMGGFFGKSRRCTV